jgi:hypothetical protein
MRGVDMTCCPQPQEAQQFAASSFRVATIVLLSRSAMVKMCFLLGLPASDLADVATFDACSMHAYHMVGFELRLREKRPFSSRTAISRLSRAVG